ncbi:MAG: LD-carboxypeptidase, partial [Muribaculaceae bacterium]|nr:LD-carboxypeptidase [Muribaculaceae bacterium]
MEKTVVFPPSLKPGDKIAIVSPAGNVKPDLVHDAAEVLRREGFKVEIMPHALGKWGHYSGTPDERYSDLSGAFLDPEVRAILCSRGGYGVVH